MLSNRVELGKAVSQLLKLVDLLVTQLLGLLVLFLKLGQLLSQVG